MDIIDAPLPVEKPTGPIVSQPQPVAALQGLDPTLDDNAVRQAIANAEANNQDPTTVTIADMTAGQSQTPTPQAPVQPEPTAPEAPKVEVPQKFLKPDGEVDVEKLKASTEQLNEAVKQKEQAVTKSVDDWVKEYERLEKRLSSLPNPQKLAASLPSPQPAQVPPQQAAPAFNPAQMSEQELEALINQDFQRNPGRTVAQLVQMALDQRLHPIEHEKKLGTVRSNIAEIAKNDPRVLRQDIFNAINAKLENNPVYMNLPNPHKVAWLEVKEELRLGEPSQVQAQPSRPTAPVLGGGTPPSAPSVSVPTTPQNIIANLDKIDLKDRRQEAMADAAIRAMLGNR